MPIVTACQGCGQKLSVPDKFAGGVARCPQCKQIYTVPSPQTQEPSFADAGELWLMRGEDGKVYGPVAKSELDRWVAEGRVTAASQVSRQGSEIWQAARVLYPGLVAVASDNPFADRQTAGNPYVSPVAMQTPRRFAQPHRGGAILALGIMSLVCCQLLGPVAWIMGQTDLKQIDAGIIDPEGRSLTQIGMILGIVGTILIILPIVLQILLVFARLG